MKATMTLLLLSLGVFCAMGQDFSTFASGMPQMNAVLLSLSAHTNGFTALVNMELFTPEGRAEGTLPFRWSVVDGICRQELLLTQMTQLPPEAREGFKRIGFESLVIISRPDRKLVYVIQPTLRAYCEVPIPQPVLDDIAKRTSALRLSSTRLGDEAVGEHACEKLEVVEASSPDEIATVWRAKDLDAFPVRIKVSSPRRLMKATLSEVRLRKPDAALMEPPVGYLKLLDGKAFIPYALELQKKRRGQNESR